MGTIRMAYSLDTADVDDCAVKQWNCVVEGFAIFEKVKAIYDGIGWRSKYFHVALRECFERMEPGQLLVLLSALSKV